MEYEEYIQHQIAVSLLNDNPHYREGERRAIDWFFQDVPTYLRILDVGCGKGDGLDYLRSKGYFSLDGIDLKPEKVAICKERLLNVIEGDVMKIEPDGKKYHVIWSSHSFEHMFQPGKALEKLLSITYPESLFFFVLPYPDTGDGRGHIGGFELGTRIDDGGETVVKWFEKRGLELVEKRLDNFREVEIWLKFKKNMTKITDRI